MKMCWCNAQCTLMNAWCLTVGKGVSCRDDLLPLTSCQIKRWDLWQEIILRYQGKILSERNSKQFDMDISLEGTHSRKVNFMSLTDWPREVKHAQILHCNIYLYMYTIRSDVHKDKMFIKATHCDQSMSVESTAATKHEHTVVVQHHLVSVPVEHTHTPSLTICSNPKYNEWASWGYSRKLQLHP